MMNTDMPVLPEAFLARMRGALGEGEFAAFLQSYARPVCRGIRVNTLKITREEFEKISPFALRPVPWEENGFYVAEEKVGRHPYHFAGLYYSQEPSAMSAAPALEVRPGERVLDLCAAPGGKSTQLAQAMQGEGILVCNEIVSSRARILSQNIERLGVTNAVVLNADPQSLVPVFHGYFDKILVDAPCSGEGMFRKNEREALENWSKENVRMCAERQRAILGFAAEMLRAGGRIVYSTCTFAPAEDEEQAADFVRTRPDFVLRRQEKLYPHKIEGEGHFYAVFDKTAEGDGNAEGGSASRRGALPLQKSNAPAAVRQAFEAFCAENLTRTPSGTLFCAGDAVYLLPEGCFSLQGLPVLRAGVRAGEIRKGRFEPSHALAVALQAHDFRRTVTLGGAETEKYLRGEILSSVAENGWCGVLVDGHPLGWGKITGGVVKNHFPKGLRLLK